MKKIIIAFFVVYIAIIQLANAKDVVNVFAKSGNIYYSNSNVKYFQLTHTGKDSSPILSPDKTIVAFVRIGNQVMPTQCLTTADIEGKYGNQIWVYNFKSSKEYLLVKNNTNCNEPEQQIVDPKDLIFSPDGKTLYFITSAWTTSGAVHAVNIDSKHQRYFIPGSSLEVILKGQSKGDLVVSQHRYFIAGGSYDWYWLYSPDGKEQGPIGEDFGDDQKEVLEM